MGRAPREVSPYVAILVVHKQAKWTAVVGLKSTNSRCISRFRLADVLKEGGDLAAVLRVLVDFGAGVLIMLRGVQGSNRNRHRASLRHPAPELAAMFDPISREFSAIGVTALRALQRGLLVSYSEHCWQSGGFACEMGDVGKCNYLYRVQMK